MNLIIFIVFFIISYVYCKIIDVDVSGNVENDGKLFVQRFQTAISAAQSGDVVRLPAGTFAIDGTVTAQHSSW